MVNTAVVIMNDDEDVRRGEKRREEKKKSLEKRRAAQRRTAYCSTGRDRGTCFRCLSVISKDKTTADAAMWRHKNSSSRWPHSSQKI
jgi:hypothetical protein